MARKVLVDIDDLMDILIIKEYLHIIMRSERRFPEFRLTDPKWCYQHLKKATDHILSGIKREELMTREMEFETLYDEVKKVIDPFMKKRGCVFTGGVSDSASFHLHYQKDRYDLFEKGVAITLEIPGIPETSHLNKRGSEQL